MSRPPGRPTAPKPAGGGRGGPSGALAASRAWSRSTAQQARNPLLVLEEQGRRLLPCAARSGREVRPQVRRRLGFARCRDAPDAGAGTQRGRLRRALGPHRPRRVPGLAADHRTRPLGAGPAGLRRPQQHPSSAPSARTGTAGSTRRSNRRPRRPAKQGASTRPTRRTPPRIPSTSCMNAFAHPTGNGHGLRLAGVDSDCRRSGCCWRVNVHSLAWLAPAPCSSRSR
jgi:hypothetical protein